MRHWKGSRSVDTALREPRWAPGSRIPRRPRPNSHDRCCCRQITATLPLELPTGCNFAIGRWIAWRLPRRRPNTSMNRGMRTPGRASVRRIRNLQTAQNYRPDRVLPKSDISRATNTHRGGLWSDPWCGAILRSFTIGGARMGTFLADTEAMIATWHGVTAPNEPG